MSFTLCLAVAAMRLYVLKDSSAWLNMLHHAYPPDVNGYLGHG